MIWTRFFDFFIHWHITSVLLSFDSFFFRILIKLRVSSDLLNNRRFFLLPNNSCCYFSYTIKMINFIFHL